MRLDGRFYTSTFVAKKGVLVCIDVLEFGITWEVEELRARANVLVGGDHAYASRIGISLAERKWSVTKDAIDDANCGHLIGFLLIRFSHGASRSLI